MAQNILLSPPPFFNFKQSQTTFFPFVYSLHAKRGPTSPDHKHSKPTHLRWVTWARAERLAAIQLPASANLRWDESTKSLGCCFGRMGAK